MKSCACDVKYPIRTYRCRANKSPRPSTRVRSRARARAHTSRVHSGERVEFSRGFARRRRPVYIESVYRRAVRGYAAAAPRCRGETQVTPTGRRDDTSRARADCRSHPRPRRLPQKRRRRVNTEGYATRQHVDHDARVDGRRRSPADASSGKSQASSSSVTPCRRHSPTARTSPPPLLKVSQGSCDSFPHTVR